MKYFIPRYWSSRLKQSFDRWAPNYEAQVIPKLKKRGYDYDVLAASICSALQPSLPIDRKVRILELGIGTGLAGAAVAKRLVGQFELIGIDISSEMIAQAKLKGVYQKIMESDVECLPSELVGNDGVFTCFMFHSLLQPAVFLSEIRSRLRPSARLVLIDLFRPTASTHTNRFQDFVSGLRHENGAPTNYISMFEAADLMERAGFNVINTSHLDRNKAYLNDAPGKRHHGMIVGQKK